MVVDSVPSVAPPRSAAHHWRLIVCILLPFAAGFYLSYLLRTINALNLHPADIRLGAQPRRSRLGDVGLLPDHGTMAVLQVPVGVGARSLWSAANPERVVAAAGAALFAMADGL
jgi:hypothetical protein